MQSHGFVHASIATLTGVVLLCILGLTYPSSINNFGRFLVDFVSNETTLHIASWTDYLTEPIIIAPIFFGVTGWVAREDVKKAMVFFAATILAYASIFFIKPLFAVSRPDAAVLSLSDFAFPSGHTTMAVFLALTCSYLLGTQKKRSSCTAAILAWAVAVVVILSRLILQVHTLIDVLGGIILGLLWMQIFRALSQANLESVSNPL